MTVRSIATLALTGCAILAGCAAPTRTAMPAPATAIPATTAHDCLRINEIRESRVRDDRTIDFYLRTGGVLRNTLPYSCPQLGFEQAFTYKTSISQLCSTDTITVIIQGGGPLLGATCGLGKFVPISTAAAEAKR